MQRTLLVIEDNEQSLYMMTFLLHKYGYDVVQARDGREGVALASQVKPALILLDIQLPVIDGFAVAQALRSNTALARVPIIAVTSYAMARDRERILAAGCTDYLEKPIDPETFMGYIEHYLSVGQFEEGGEP